MYVKPIKPPIIIKQLEALLRRIPKNHPMRDKIQDDLRGYSSGYAGEKSLDFYFNQLPDKEYYTFHNLRLIDDKTPFQIDFLLLTLKFIIIFEVKNHTGHLQFDEENSQLIQTKSTGEIKVYNDPVIQILEHKRHLHNYISRYKLPIIPIKHYVVIANQNAIISIKSLNKLYKESIIRSNILLREIFNINEQNKKSILTSKELKKFINCFLLNNKERTTNIFENYNISPELFINGVYCEKCGMISMTRIRSNWKCTNCDFLSENAHLNTLNDYILLIDTKINNGTFRKITKLNSRKIAFTLLENLNLESNGKLRYLEYTLPPSGFNS